MLVLSRKEKESICISDNVVVTVLSIRGSQVKVGIEAPRGTPVHRKEVYAKIEEEEVAGHVAGGTKGE
jgi:carbon storage regulator